MNPSSPLKKALLQRSQLRRYCVGLVDPCSTALQGRLRRLDFALLASTKMAVSLRAFFNRLLGTAGMWPPAGFPAR